MTNIDAVGAPPPPPPPPCRSPTVTLELERDTLTLKHARANHLRVVVAPPSCRVSGYRIEIQRASGGAWFPLATRPSFWWLARVAGRFKLRATATVEGSDVQSAPVDCEVRFPTYGQIVADSEVRRAMNALWALTLNDCTRRPNQRREHGCWIELDTRANRYVFTHRATGGWSGPGAGASVNLPGRPADTPANPDPNAAGARYPVASFHTHTPTTYRTGLGLLPRPIGPSGADNRADTSDQVPGIVYDYAESPPGSGSIPIGHPKRGAARLYRSLGVDPRPTP